MNRQGKTHDAVEERMPSANKAFWKDIEIYKGKDVPWRIKCQRLVDHVYAVFSFGSETWSWTQQTLKNQKVGNKNNDEVVPPEKTKKRRGSNTRQEPSVMARKILVRMTLPFLYEKCGKYVTRHGWACHEKENAVIFSLKKVCKWRSATRWQSLHTRMMKEDPENRTRWKHKWGWHNRGNVWHMMATCWAGKKDWMITRKEQNSTNDK